MDGLRAVAILIVVSAHLGAGNILPGGFGVTLFFFISGYLITRLMIDEHRSNGRIDIRNFYIRRFLRLSPALYAMVITVAFIFSWIEPIPLLRTLAAAFYFTNYYLIIAPAFATPFSPTWSLAVEEHYYLFFPLLFSIGWRSPKRFLILLGAIAFAMLIWRCALIFGMNAQSNRTFVASDTRIDSILYGAILAVGLHLHREEVAKWSNFVWPLATAALGASFYFHSPEFRETARYSLQGLALMPLIYCAILSEKFALLRRRLLEPAPLVWIGRLSYSLYLWHFPILMLTERLVLPMPAFILMNIVLDSLVACASYFLIEKQFLKIRHSFKGRPKHATNPVSA